MEAIAHNPAFAKKVGVPQSVGQDFSKADKGKTFKKGGETMATKKMNPFMAMIAKKKEAAKGGMAKGDMAQDKKMIKKAFKQHDAQEHKGGSGTKLALKKGGMMKKMAGGGLAAGHKDANGVAKKGLTKGTMVKMNMGGRAC